MTRLFLRDALSRARQFLDLADQCSVSEQDQYEMFLEATIVFGRTALHRLKHQHEDHSDWDSWWEGLLRDEAVQFFQIQRNHLLKVGPTRLHQRIRLDKATVLASEHYYLETPDVPATATIKRYLDRMVEIVADGAEKFGI